MKEQTAKKQRSLWQDAWRRFKKNKTALYNWIETNANRAEEVAA